MKHAAQNQWNCDFFGANLGTWVKTGAQAGKGRGDTPRRQTSWAESVGSVLAFLEVMSRIDGTSRTDDLSKHAPLHSEHEYYVRGESLLPFSSLLAILASGRDEKRQGQRARTTCYKDEETLERRMTRLSHDHSLALVLQFLPASAPDPDPTAPHLQAHIPKSLRQNEKRSPLPYPGIRILLRRTAGPAVPQQRSACRIPSIAEIWTLGGTVDTVVMTT